MALDVPILKHCRVYYREDTVDIFCCVATSIEQIEKDTNLTIWYFNNLDNLSQVYWKRQMFKGRVL